MSDKILDVHNLQVQFQTNEQLIRAVDGISFQLNRGQTLGIVGESGSGKSVTALAVMGLVPSPPGKVTGGEISFRGLKGNGGVLEPIDLLKLPENQRQQYRGNQISMIFQEPMSSLNPVYTCGFQLIEALRQHQTISKAEARRQAIALLQEVKLIPSNELLRHRCLEEWHQHTTASPNTQPDERQLQHQINYQKLAFLDRYPHQLSGGQIQRVMIAIAISCNPAILIADEPTTALDVTVQATILDLLRELRDRRGMSIIFVTHDLSTIAEIADSVAVMYQGKIVEYGLVEQIYTNPQHPYTKGLLTCRPQPDRRLKYLPTISDFMESVTIPTGEQVLREKPAPAIQALVVTEAELEQRLAQLQQRSPLLSVQNLQVFFPVRGVFGQTARYVAAVNGVSFEVYPGETLGLVGESGCGKTTLGRSLLRLVEPTGGQILFDNQQVTALRQPQLRRLRREMQMIFQDPYGSLDPRMSIGDAVMEPMRVHGTESNERQRRTRAAYLLERVGLNPGLMRRYPHEFSGGQRQRICIARALALNPKFIICDESVSALDVSIQAQVLNLLKELQDEFNLTYIFISHDLSVVKFMSDRIIVMNQGKIEEIGSAEQIYRSPQKPYTRQLIASIPTGTLPATRKNSTRVPRSTP
jgi:peptide/nickel transport system ATP-binding protein